MGRFRSPSIGLDIDRSAIKAVQAVKSRSGYVLQHVGYHKLPPGTIVEGEVADHDLLASEIKEFWSSHSFKGKSVLLGVANQKVVVRLVDFPRMSEEDLKSAIGFEAQDHIPMPMDEAVMDYLSLGPAGEGSELDRILIVAAQRDMISRFSSAVRAGGLRPVGVDVKALALTRSILPEASLNEDSAVVLLDIGAEITNLVISQGGAPTFTRSLPGGSFSFAQAISEAANLDEEAAEKQLMNPKVRIGSALGEEEPETNEQKELEDEAQEDDFDPALSYDVRRGIEDAVGILAEDIQRSIEYHYSQPGAQEVSEVWISGEGAMVGGIDEYLGELLGVRTSKGHPLQKLAENRSNVPQDQLQVMEPVLAIALGLSMDEA